MAGVIYIEDCKDEFLGNGVQLWGVPIVTFWKNDLERQSGSDGGGLGREYFDLLISGLKRRLGMGSVHGQQLLPQTKEDIKVDSKSLFASLTDDEVHNFYRLGQVMAKGHKKVMMGYQFSQAIFEPILYFAQQDDLPEDFEGLFLADRLRACKLFLSALKEEHKVHVNELIRYVDMALKLQTAGDDWFDKDYKSEKNPSLTVTDVANALVDDELYPAEFKTENEYGDDVPNLNAIKQNRKEFEELLLNFIMRKVEGDWQLGRQLPVWHAIALGVKQVGVNLNLTAEALSRSIQGLQIDRQKIVDEMKYTNDAAYNAVTDQKVMWLKDWLLNTATDEEVADFLRFVSGAPSLGQDKYVKIAVTNGKLPVPAAATCFETLTLGNEWSTDPNTRDDNEQAFIAWVVYAMNQVGYSKA